MFSTLSDLPPDQARALIPRFVSGYADAPEALREEVAAAVADALGDDDEAMRAMLRRFAAIGQEHAIYPADPLARRMSRAYMAVVTRGSAVQGLHQLAGLDGPQLWIGNHLSYVDTQATDALLAAAGAAALADGLLAVAGPKVYGDPFRRMAALCLSTLHTAQSTRLSTNEAELSPREVAAIALRSVKQAADWRQQRGPVLLYPEGSRSRSGRMGSFLRAVDRYARGAAWIVPVAVVDTHHLFGMDERMRPSVVGLRVGAPIATSSLPSDRSAPLEAAWEALAALLPEHLRPEPDTPVLV